MTKWIATGSRMEAELNMIRLQLAFKRTSSYGREYKTLPVMSSKDIKVKIGNTVDVKFGNENEASRRYYILDMRGDALAIDKILLRKDGAPTGDPLDEIWINFQPVECKRINSQN